MLKKLYLPFILLYSLTSWGERLIILHTNDHHGHFAPEVNGDFGLAAQSTLVKKIRAEAASQSDTHLLLLSGGDINTGTPESNMFNAAPDIQSMNAIGYDAMAIGNHEFDHSLSVLKEQEKMAKFDFLASNITDESGRNIFKPYISKMIGQYRVAIVGISTPDTPLLSVPENVRGVIFENPFQKTKKLISELKQNHDYIIVLSHLGFYPNESHGINFPGDITLAKEIPDIDVIVGAHTHTEIQRPVLQGKTIIVQAKESGQFLGKLELELGPSTMSMKNYELIPVKNIPQDPEILSLTRPFLEKADQRLKTKIGRSSAEFIGGRGVIDTNEHPLGNLVAQAQKEATKADIAIVDSKGLRTGLPKGELTLRDLLNVAPFGNTLCTVELSAEELWQTIQNVYDKFISQGQQMYFSKDVSFKLEKGKLSEVLIKGKSVPIESGRKFRLAINNFLADGGSGFIKYRQHASFKDTGVTDISALESFFKARKELDPAQFIHRTYDPYPVCNQHLL